MLGPLYFINWGDRMSEKHAKRYARVMRRNRDKIIINFFSEIKNYGFLDRLSIAWMILTAKKGEKDK